MRGPISAKWSWFVQDSSCAKIRDMWCYTFLRRPVCVLFCFRGAAGSHSVAISGQKPLKASEWNRQNCRNSFNTRKEEKTGSIQRNLLLAG
jgi:hypothetical protein